MGSFVWILNCLEIQSGMILDSALMGFLISSARR